MNGKLNVAASVSAENVVAVTGVDDEVMNSYVPWTIDALPPIVAAIGELRDTSTIDDDRRQRADAELEQGLEHHLGTRDAGALVVTREVEDVRLARGVVLHAAAGQVGNNHRPSGGLRRARAAVVGRRRRDVGQDERLDLGNQRHDARLVDRARRRVRQPGLGVAAHGAPPVVAGLRERVARIREEHARRTSGAGSDRSSCGCCSSCPRSSASARCRTASSMQRTRPRRCRGRSGTAECPGCPRRPRCSHLRSSSPTRTRRRGRSASRGTC